MAQPKTHTGLDAMVQLRDQLAPLLSGADTAGLLGSFRKTVAFDSEVGDALLSDEGPSDARPYMYGVALVRDLSGNRHYVAASHNPPKPDGHGLIHVESQLKDMIVTHFKKPNTGNLTTAKVSFFVPASPCKQCTGMIQQWCFEMTTAIANVKTVSDCRTIFYVFNFLHYYDQTRHKPHRNVWKDEHVAKAEYKKITDSDNTMPIPYKKGGSYKVPFINFRQGTWDKTAQRNSFGALNKKVTK